MLSILARAKNKANCYFSGEQYEGTVVIVEQCDDLMEQCKIYRSYHVEHTQYAVQNPHRLIIAVCTH